MLFGWLLFRQRVTAGDSRGPRPLSHRRRGAAGAELRSSRPAGALGDLFGIATGVFFGLYFLAVKAARKTASAARVTFEATLITAAILFVVAVAPSRAAAA